MWCACLTHNIYTLYYKNRKNLNKRITLYKYTLYIAIAITYVFVLFGRNKTCEDNNEGFINKKCSLMCYTKEFLVLFYFCCCGMFVYILRGLFYIMKASKNSFISLNEENRRDVKVKNMMDSLILRNLMLIWYFVVCFIPITFQVILRMCFEIEGAENYYFTYVGFVLVSFYGCFVALVQLMDPAIRNYICLLWGVGTVFITKTNSTDDLLGRAAVIGHINEEESISSEDEMRYSVDNHRGNHHNEESSCDNKCYGSSNNNNNNTRIEMVDMISNHTANTHNCNNNNNKTDKDVTYCNEGGVFSNDENSFVNVSNISTNNNNNNNDNNVHDYVYHRKSKHSNSQKLKESNYKDTVHSTDLCPSSLPFHHHHHCSLDDNHKPKTALNPSLCKSDKYIIPPQQAHPPIRHVKTNLKHRSFSKHGLTRTTRTFIRNYRKVYTKFILNENTVDFNLVNYHLDLADNLLRMLAISISINESHRYYNNYNYSYSKYYSSFLPWKEDKFYKEKTPWQTYTQATIPENFPAKTDNRFRSIHFKVKSFCPLVFHHLRLIDKVSIDELIQSLDPIKNLSLFNELGVSGGRGDNSISYTWDKKMLIKTITKQEKRLFKHQMLRNYHSRMRDTKSLLCRIYGLFKIEINNKGSIHVLLQKNMCALPHETHLLTFDLKGSTVDRQCISAKDANELSKEVLMEKYKNSVLKDKDLSILQIKFNLSSFDGRNLLTCIEKDSEFLQEYNITDYSLLVFVHKYQKEVMFNNLGNLRIMRSVDCKYIFNFSIIDFLGTFNLEKKGEKIAKEFVAYIKKMKDTNFSVMDPVNYGGRFINYSQTIITVENDDDE